MVDFTGKRLPIFRLAEPSLDRAKIDLLAREFGLEEQPETDIPGGGVRREKGTRYLEATPEGRYWFADDDQLWNPARIPASLPSSEEAAGRAGEILHRLGIIPPVLQGGAKLLTTIAINTRTKTACASVDKYGKATRRDCHDLDAYVGLRIQVVVTNPATQARVPVDTQGAGTKVGIVFGDGGAVIGLSASWRDVVAIEDEVSVLPPVAPVKGGASARSAMVDRDSFELIYRVTRLASGVSCLCPYWLFRVAASHGDEHFRSVDVTTPAAEFEVANPGRLGLQYEPRTPESTPTAGTGATAIGLSWITDGKAEADNEALQVLVEAAAARLDVRFAWRDNDAWESDWSSDAKRWIDNVDVAYYAGHAYRHGWQLTFEDAEKFVTRETVGKSDTSGALWGDRLRWAMIAACGPLQDECAESPGYSAFLWAGAFDNFRLLMGFGSSIGGFSGEGGRTLALSRRGVPLARAWLRASREAQPSLAFANRVAGNSGRWVAVLAAETDSESALDDVLPEGAGKVAGPMEPTRLRAIWTAA
jgi:hypothetical protein